MLCLPGCVRLRLVHLLLRGQLGLLRGRHHEQRLQLVQPLQRKLLCRQLRILVHIIDLMSLQHGLLLFLQHLQLLPQCRGVWLVLLLRVQRCRRMCERKHLQRNDLPLSVVLLVLLRQYWLLVRLDLPNRLCATTTTTLRALFLEFLLILQHLQHLHQPSGLRLVLLLLVLLFRKLCGGRALRCILVRLSLLVQLLFGDHPILQLQYLFRLVVSLLFCIRRHRHLEPLLLQWPGRH